MPPPPGSSAAHSRTRVTDSPSPIDTNDNPPSSSRLSRDSEGYPSWLPKRPPPPAPASTFQSSVLALAGGVPPDPSPSPVEPTFTTGRKPTPRSVRIVSLHDSFVGAVEKEPSRREPTDQTRVGVHVPPKVWTRAAGVPVAFNASNNDDGFLPLPQPRFNAKHLNLQMLRNPSRWMKAYFYLWPLLVFYHLPLQSFFDFNAVYILLQVARFPNPQTSGKNWALGAAAYIACWLAWIFAVCIMYELVYSFARRWRLRRPLILPIYLSSSAFNLAALTSYNAFSFLQHLRLSAFFPEHARALSPLSPSDPDYSFADEQDQDYYGQESSWKQGLAETCFFYSQNLPTVALLLPRAGLCLALLFAFGSAPEVLSVFGVTTSGAGNLARRDATFFRQDGSLTGYARGVLIANAAWTAWRVLVLLASWLGLWIFSKQRLAGLCEPRHTWEESEQEKTRSVYSEAASEYGAYRGSVYPTGAAIYNSGDGEAASYRGDELAWEWREATRMRVQDAFEFCLNTRRRSSSGGASTLRWASAATPAGYNYGSRRYRHRRRKSSKAKGKEPSTEHENEKAAGTGESEQFEGIERVLAAVGFPGAASAASPSRRAPLSKDLFSAPEGLAKEPIDPIQYEQIQPGPSSGMYTGLDAPKMAKRNSKDKIPGSSAVPYPFSSPGAGHVSSEDSVSVPFPGGKKAKTSSKESGTSSSEEHTTSQSGSRSASGTGSGSGSGSGSGEGEEEEEEEEEEDDEEEEDEEEDLGSEGVSSGPSGSMSSLGQPISSPARYPFGMRRPGAGHHRNMSGVSSALSSGQGGSGGSHAHSHSVGSHAHSHSVSSRGTRSAGAMSVITQSTGNFETTDDEEEQGRERGVSQGSSAAGIPIPMPPRHPHPHTPPVQGRGRAGTGPTPSSSSSSAAAAAALASINIYAPVEFPSLRTRRRVESGRAGVIVDPQASYGEGMGSDIEAQHELHGDDNGHPHEERVEEEESESERAEHEDQVGLLSVPHSPRTSLVGGSRVSLANSSSSGHGSGEARSRTHSSFSTHSSRSRHSSTRAHSRPRTLSSQAPSVRERAESLGTSMRSFIQGAAAQLDAVMRGATGPAASLGVGIGGLSSSRPRSRVNSSMARLEEDVVYSPRVTEMGERMRDASGSSASSGEHAGAVPMNHLVGRARREVEGEGYSSSGGTHSRSGSESVNGENYTFGRPVAFMRPSEQHPPPMVEVEEERDDDEIVLVQRSTGSAGRGTPAARSVPIVSRVDDQAQAQAQASGEPQSLSTSISGSYYSQQPTERTVSPTTHDAGQQPSNSPSPPHSADHSPERQGVNIPWSPQRFLAPPNQRSLHHHAHDEGTASSGSPPDISTAAGSFVTAPATIEGATTTTESSGQRTVSSSWDTNVPGVGMALRRGDVGGMVERPGEDMGAAAGGWRVV